MKILLILLLAVPVICAAETRKPNVLYIMSDDHAAHAVGAYGGRFAKLDPTPNIDRLAREGMLMRNCFCGNSICTPSRASVLTGQYSHTNGVLTLNGKLPPERQYLPKLMKEAGYETAMIGKWHLKAEPAAFDYYMVLPGQGSYFNPTFRQRGPKPWPKNEFRTTGYDSQHSSDSITKLSLQWLKKRKKDRPFFLMHHFKAPHDNFENAERYDWLYENIDMPEPETLWAEENHGSEATKGTGTSVGKRNKRRNMGHHMFVDQNLSDKDYKRTAYQRYMKKYFRTIRGVDDNIGKLLAHLEKSGELDNTIIIYTSDQGFMLGEHDYIDKRWIYEESLRMPFIVRYPPWIQAGSQSDVIVNNTDFAPTILSAAGTTAPDYMQGHSFLPVLRGEGAPAGWRTAHYYRYWMHMAHHENPAHYGIRTKDHKLVFFYGRTFGAKAGYKNSLDVPTQPGWEFYDINKDPHETKNLYNDPSYAVTIKKLKADLLRTKEELGDTDEKYPELMEIRKQYWGENPATP